MSSAASRKAHRVRRRLDDVRGTPPRPTRRQVEYLRAMGLRQVPLVYLAAELEVGVHTAGEMVRRLERAGWVRRAPSRRRRRMKLVELTGAGITALLVEHARAFGESMATQGIHVGIGSPPRCATCGVAWPCAAASPTPEPPCLADA